jgi:hypothetical protein
MTMRSSLSLSLSLSLSQKPTTYLRRVIAFRQPLVNVHCAHHAALPIESHLRAKQDKKRPVRKTAVCFVVAELAGCRAHQESGGRGIIFCREGEQGTGHVGKEAHVSCCGTREKPLLDSFLPVMQ